jgi:phage tail-like protein
MNEDATTQYRYLNREGLWSGWKWRALERDADGSLQLIRLPRLQGAVPQTIRSGALPTGPAGVTVTGDGTVYFSDPMSYAIRQIGGCDGDVCAVPCMGRDRGGLRRILGLAYSKMRRALFASDSSEHCVKVIDADSGQTLALLGQPYSGASGTPGAAPGRLNTPWGIACDADGSIYVVDYGNARVQKWNAAGDLVADFWNNVALSKRITKPLEVCAAEIDGQTRIFILDGAALAVTLFDGKGTPVVGADGQPVAIGSGVLQMPMGMSASGDVVYIGDNQARRILAFSVRGVPSYLGQAWGYEGPVAALSVDGAGGLWVHPGTADPPQKLVASGGYASSGVLWTEQPITLDYPKVQWQRLKAELDPLPPNTHLEFLVYTSNDSTAGPTVTKADPLSDPKWRRLSTSTVDLDDVYIGGCPATYLWLAAEFIGDGLATPLLSQIRVQFDQSSYLDYLPAIYRNETSCAPAGARFPEATDFLQRFLSLFESIYGDVEAELASLPALLDAQATPKQFLAWLAGCLGLQLDETWTEAKEREVLGEIFKFYGRRGTPAGLRLALKLFAGIDAVIEEPLLAAEWWALPSTVDSCCDECATIRNQDSWQGTANSILGFTTMLAAAQPQGAVVGTTAVLDQSHLITADEFGAPLFRDVAYRFNVQLYRGQLACAEALPRVRAVLAQEMPAHTAYQISIVEPRMRIGYQSRIGIDTVVGGVARTFSLGSQQTLGEETVLAGPVSTRLGQSRLGLSTRVG